jgi:hypothetical protein
MGVTVYRSPGNATTIAISVAVLALLAGLASWWSDREAGKVVPVRQLVDGSAAGGPIARPDGAAGVSSRAVGAASEVMVETGELPAPQELPKVPDGRRAEYETSAEAGASRVVRADRVPDLESQAPVEIELPPGVHRQDVEIAAESGAVTILRTTSSAPSPAIGEPATLPGDMEMPSSAPTAVQDQPVPGDAELPVTSVPPGAASDPAAATSTLEAAGVTLPIPDSVPSSSRL